jgi:hypothetical protein
MTDLNHIDDAVTYLLDLFDPSDALYVEAAEGDDTADLHDHIIAALEAMHAHLEAGNPVPRTKP